MTLSAWIILGLAVAFILWVGLGYNRLVAMRQQCNQAFGEIDVQLKQRHDLVPNLVETVRSYAGHERGTLDAVVQARTAAMVAQGPSAKAQAETVLGGALRQLFALAEAYPNLKANSNFQQLQSALTTIEDNIAESRRSLNAMVQGYNSLVQQFPTAMLASTFGFAPHEYFDIGDEGQREAPQVKF